MSSLKKITIDELRSSLRRGTFRFYYRKTNGDLRAAIGTLQLERIPESSRPKGGKISERQLPYYDLERGEWRSVSKMQEIWSE